MSENKRERGYYWVKYADEWHIAHWDPDDFEDEHIGLWLFESAHYYDGYFREVFETRIITPDEDKEIAIITISRTGHVKMSFPKDFKYDVVLKMDPIP